MAWAIVDVRGLCMISGMLIVKLDAPGMAAVFA